MTKFREQDTGAMFDRDLAAAIHRHCETHPAKYRWHTDDLLSGMEPPEIRPGLRLDAKITAVAVKDIRGDVDLESLEIGPVYLKPDSLEDILLLDQEALRTRHKCLYKDFEVWAENEAIRQARAATDGLIGPGCWVLIDDEDSAL